MLWFFVGGPEPAADGIVGANRRSRTPSGPDVRYRIDRLWRRRAARAQKSVLTVERVNASLWSMSSSSALAAFVSSPSAMAWAMRA